MTGLLLAGGAGFACGFVACLILLAGLVYRNDFQQGGRG